MPDIGSLKQENQKLLQELKRQAFELSVLYEITGSISSTLTYDDLLLFIMESLHKIIEYDICASLLITEEKKTKMSIRLLRPLGATAIEMIKQKAVNALESLRGEPFSLEGAEVLIKGEVNDACPGAESLRSSFDVPLFVREKAIGVLSVAGAGDAAYSDNEIRLFYTLVSQAQGSIERLQAMIAVEKNKMKNMVERMAEGVIMFDEHRRLVLFNAAARQMLAYQGTAEDAFEVFEFLGNIGLSFLPQGFSCGAQAAPFVKEVYLQKPYPRIIHAETVSLSDQEKNALGTVMVLRDVTRERELDQMKNDFVSLVSHELRTPLVAIRGATDNMLKEALGPLNTAQKEFLTLSKRNIERLERLISDLLDVARIEAGRMQLNKERTDISRLINEVAGLFREAAQEKGVSLEVSCAQGLIHPQVDADKIAQVLSNLLGNALKFTPSGGSLRIEAFLREDCVYVSISDSGIGIPPEDLGKVFDKFYQVAMQDKTGVKGTGLGLAICKGIIEKHGGKIWAESKPGKGSTFTFTLPF